MTPEYALRAVDIEFGKGRGILGSGTEWRLVVQLIGVRGELAFQYTEMPVP